MTFSLVTVQNRCLLVKEEFQHILTQYRRNSLSNQLFGEMGFLAKPRSWLTTFQPLLIASSLLPPLKRKLDRTTATRLWILQTWCDNRCMTFYFYNKQTNTYLVDIQKPVITVRKLFCCYLCGPRNTGHCQWFVLILITVLGPHQ